MVTVHRKWKLNLKSKDTTSRRKMAISQMDHEEPDLALEHKRTSDKQSCQVPTFNRLRFPMSAKLSYP